MKITQGILKLFNVHKVWDRKYQRPYYTCNGLIAHSEVEMYQKIKKDSK